MRAGHRWLPPEGTPLCLPLCGAQGDANRSDTDEDKTSTHLEEDFDKFSDLRATGEHVGSGTGIAGTPKGRLWAVHSLPGSLAGRASPSPSRDEDVLTGCDPQRAPGGPRQPAPSPHHAHGSYTHAHPQELPAPGPGPWPPGLPARQQQLCGPPAERPEVTGRDPSLPWPQGTPFTCVSMVSPQEECGPTHTP